MDSASGKKYVPNDDTKLWHRIIEGERVALSKLFKKYHAPLLNYGLKINSRKDLVQDSIQEVFFNIWKGRSQLSDVKHVRSYLYSSLRRAVFRQIEIKDSRHERDEFYSEESFRELLNKEQLMIRKELKQEQQEKLQEAFATLTKREKEALFLKFQNGLSNDEISQVMGVNKQSVYNYIHRAVEALQDYLQSQSESAGILDKVHRLSLNTLWPIVLSLWPFFS